MPYTAADTYSDKIIYHSTDQLSECDSAPMCCCGTHSTASCLCGLSSCAVFCIDPRVVVVCSSCSKAQRGVRCTCWPGSEYRSWWTLHSPQRTSAQIAGSCGGARPSPAASVQPAGEKSYHQLIIKMLNKVPEWLTSPSISLRPLGKQINKKLCTPTQ